MNYPTQITQAWLDNQRRPEDRHFVRIELVGCYNYRPVPVPGRKTTRYLFAYDPKTACHALNVPLHLWTANQGEMPRDLFTASLNSYRLIPLVVPVPPAKDAKPAPAPLPKAKPAANRKKSAEDAALAVLAE